jgi:hypothetical protein
MRMDVSVHGLAAISAACIPVYTASLFSPRECPDPCPVLLLQTRGVLKVGVHPSNQSARWLRENALRAYSPLQLAFTTQVRPRGLMGGRLLPQLYRILVFCLRRGAWASEHPSQPLCPVLFWTLKRIP